MSTPYTFRVNGVDFSSFVQKYGYSTNYSPVAGDTVTTMDGVDHVAIIRWKGQLHVSLNPMTAAELALITEQICGVGAVMVTYTCLQRNEVVYAAMVPDAYTTEMVLQNADRQLLGNLELTFNEL